MTARIYKPAQTAMQSGPAGTKDWVLEYGYVKIEDKTYLLPNRAENMACMTGSGTCTRNVIEFRNYKKFTTESNVKFGQ